MKTIMKTILYSFTLIVIFASQTNAYANCNCDSSVELNYNLIKNKIPSRFEPVENKLGEISEELDKTIEEHENEIKLLAKQMDVKEKIYVQHKKELQQLEQTYNYYSMQNDTNIVALSASMIMLQNNIYMNSQESSKYLEKDVADYLKN